MRLTKHHGLGNDFLVLLDGRGAHPLTAARARRLCDRTRGIGADGLLRATPGIGGADLTMELLNSDGSRGLMSGNGIRCLVQAAIRAGWVSGPRVLVMTDAGMRAVDVTPGGEDPDVHTARVDMGVVEVGTEQPEWVDGSIERAVSVVTGNAHVVLQVAELPPAATVAALGRHINDSTPGGVNVEVVAPYGGDLVMSVYERGVGLTMACGTGACAAAAAARTWELVDATTTVRMPGGPVLVEIGDPGEPTHLTGPVAYIATVDVPAR